MTEIWICFIKFSANFLTEKRDGRGESGRKIQNIGPSNPGWKNGPIFFVKNAESIAAIFRVVFLAAVFGAVFILSIVLGAVGVVLRIVSGIVLGIFTHLNSPPLRKYYALCLGALYEKTDRETF